MVTEKIIRPQSGWSKLWIVLLMPFIALLIMTGVAAEALHPALTVAAIVLVLAAIVTAIGFKAVAPNDSRTFLLFGDYRGTVKVSARLIHPHGVKSWKTSRELRGFMGDRTTP